jgi:hypothetical protein
LTTTAGVPPTACSYCDDVPESSMLNCDTCKVGPLCQQCAYGHLDHKLRSIGPLVPHVFVDVATPDPAAVRKARIMGAVERFMATGPRNRR